MSIEMPELVKNRCMSKFASTIPMHSGFNRQQYFHINEMVSGLSSKRVIPQADTIKYDIEQTILL